MGENIVASGKHIACSHCDGAGKTFKAWEGWDEECSVCGGSGRNWQYNGGAIAKYYSGPLIGRSHPTPSTEKERAAS